jgi:hypothetical protein
MYGKLKKQIRLLSDCRRWRILSVVFSGTGVEKRQRCGWEKTAIADGFCQCMI